MNESDKIHKNMTVGNTNMARKAKLRAHAKLHVAQIRGAETVNKTYEYCLRHGRVTKKIALVSV